MMPKPSTRIACFARAAVLGTLIAAAAVPALAQNAGTLVVDAREALRKGDRSKLAALRIAAVSADLPLAPWVDYWEIGSRLASVSTPEIEAFYQRWPGTYVEDRLRNDWLLELGRRRDWAAFARDYPRFRMNDDREVSCYALLTQHLAGQDVREAARAAWLAQRDLDDGCNLLATTLVEARRFGPADVWPVLRQAVEFNRPRAAKGAAVLISPTVAQGVLTLLDSPAKFFKPKTHGATATGRQLAVLAVMRMASNDPDAASRELQQPWALELPNELAGVAWAAVAKQAALKLQPEAFAWYQRALGLRQKAAEPLAWSDDAMAWAVRAALRANAKPDERWAVVQTAVDAMSPTERRDPTWQYWKARALQARAATSAEGDAARAQAREMMEAIASPLNFYGKLATEDLGQRVVFPSMPAALTAEERQAASAHPGLSRALQLIALGLRGEGVREWNFTLRGMGDRELLAAAQLACDREVWDRCINTSDRTKNEIDLAQRFPTPFRNEVIAAARAIDLDPAYVYGLIRQESRFIMDARSSVGASGLMQIMPATARWTAKKLGVDYRPEMITDRDLNLKLGTGYLKLVLDDFGGSAAMAAAAYNAGPSRPRRWREGALVEAAAWAEGIPFNETRDYVKKVLSNATVYASLLKTVPVPSLKGRLGNAIGPRENAAPSADKDIP